MTARAESAGDAAAYPHWRRNKISLSAATFLLSVGFGISQPFLPLAVKELGPVEHVVTWVGYMLGGYFLLSFFLTPVWGVVADHFGRKAMVLRTSMGMGLLTLLMPVAPSLGWFVLLYLLMGTTNGFVPSCQALIAVTTPGRMMGGSLAWVASGALLGGSIGPAVGAWLAGVLPQYRHLFYANAGLVLAAGMLALLFAREQPLKPQAPFRLHLIRDLRVISRLPNLLVLLCITFAYTLTYNGSGAIISVYTLQLLERLGQTQPQQINFWVGAVSVAFTVAAAAAVPGWGWLLDRLGAPRVLGLSLALGGLASIPTVLAQTPLQLSMARFVLGMLAVGIGPGAIAIVRARAPVGMEGRVLSYSAAFGALGMGVGPFMAGEIGPVLGLRAYFALNSLLILVLLGAWLRSWERSRRAAGSNE